MLARLADHAPVDFQFLVKLPRSLSHDETTRDLAGFREALAELRRRRQLLGLLCQLPQATHRTAKHETWLNFLAKELSGYCLAVEFRHRSWFHAEVPVWLTENSMDVVSVDVPDLPNLYPRGLVQSSSRLYVRFHSRRAENWYKSDKDR